MSVILVPILRVLHAILGFYYWVVVIAVILNLLVAFNVINSHNQVIRMIGNSLHAMTEPVFRRIRRYVPIMGNLDLSPLVVIFAIMLLQYIIAELIPAVAAL
ncbi:MAG: YggT family protein [Rhodospirillaceae bacterium]